MLSGLEQLLNHLFFPSGCDLRFLYSRFWLNTVSTTLEWKSDNEFTCQVVKENLKYLCIFREIRHCPRSEAHSANWLYQCFFHFYFCLCSVVYRDRVTCSAIKSAQLQASAWSACSNQWICMHDFFSLLCWDQGGNVLIGTLHAAWHISLSPTAVWQHRRIGVTASFFLTLHNSEVLKYVL